MNARIRPAKADCTRIQTQLVLAPDEDAKRGLFGQCFERSTGSESNVRGQPIGRLADRISGSLRRLVIDDTGVQGNVDLTLIWDFTTDSAQSNAWMLVALEEQLGLKVVSRRVAMPIVVIERIARPSPN